MEITVKNVKIAQFASDETLCFETTVYIDGKRGFRASNDGHGGCNMYEGSNDLYKAAEAWATAQPMIVDESLTNDDGTPFSYQPDLDHFVDEAIADWQTGKELDRILRKIAIVEDGKVSTFKATAARLTDAARANIAKRYPNARIMNDLPRTEAMAIWKATAA